MAAIKSNQITGTALWPLSDIIWEKKLFNLEQDKGVFLDHFGLFMHLQKRLTQRLCSWIKNYAEKKRDCSDRKWKHKRL